MGRTSSGENSRSQGPTIDLRASPSGALIAANSGRWPLRDRCRPPRDRGSIATRHKKNSVRTKKAAQHSLRGLLSNNTLRPTRELSVHVVAIRRDRMVAIAMDDLALADMVGSADKAFLLHAFDERSGAVVADAQATLDIGGRAFLVA
jgi:hypothetical protein